jgi:hypothetical protein
VRLRRPLRIRGGDRRDEGAAGGLEGIVRADGDLTGEQARPSLKEVTAGPNAVFIMNWV